MNEYIKQAEDFLTATGTKMAVEFTRNGKHFDSDTHNRDIYKVTFKRGNRSFSLEFGQSIINSQHYTDTLQGRTYTTDGKARTGNYNITDIDTYKAVQKLTLVKGDEPSAYDVLACLQKYEVGSFEDFCGDFGYDTDSRSAKKTYKAVKKEFSNVCKIWTDEEIELLQEIS